MKTIYQCSHCQSDNVQIKAWVKPNDNNTYVDEVNPDEPGWCDDEELSSIIETVQVEDDAEVIGYQVVGEDGTPKEGEIHPQMDGSFCIYNLEQAHSILEESNNVDEHGMWKLLTIWTGDVEEPLMMFEGNPRA